MLSGLCATAQRAFRKSLLTARCGFGTSRRRRNWHEAELSIIVVPGVVHRQSKALQFAERDRHFDSLLGAGPSKSDVAARLALSGRRFKNGNSLVPEANSVQHVASMDAMAEEGAWQQFRMRVRTPGR